MKILIIDDSELFRIAMEAMLKESGYNNIILKDSVSTAIEYLEQDLKQSADKQVDLILMDIQMPEINGIEGVKIIKNNDVLKNIPIVMVSVMDEEKNIERAFTAGAIDFISKPVKKLELKARVRSILKLKEEMDKRAERESELRHTIQELQVALKEIKNLSGLLPICSSCKKIRDDSGYWQQVEKYIQDRSDVDFSHGICPDCIKELYPDIADEIL